MRCFELLFLLSALLTHLGFSTAQPIYVYHSCSVSNYSRNSTFRTNLNLLLSSLVPSKITIDDGFYNTTMGQNPDRVYSLFLCRGDVTAEVCRNCINTASEEIIQLCPNQTAAVTWYEECMLRYSNTSFFGVVEMDPSIFMYNTQNNSQPDEPDISAQYLIYGLILKAPNSRLMFAAENLNATESEIRYGLVQCSRDLTRDDCRTCLSRLTENIRDCCEGKKGWRLVTPSCYMRYEAYPFFQQTVEPTVPVPVPQPVPSTPDTTSKGKAKTLRTVIITTVAAILAAVLLGCCIYSLWSRKIMQKGKTEKRQENRLHGLHAGPITKLSHENINTEVSDESQDFPLIPLSTVLVATGNFSDRNKLGEGGFGPVYKGTLSDGKEIAVKRLSRTSVQGLEEFKNEVILIAKLQHRNLVRLLSCCIEDDEKLLNYEFMPNKSLDLHLFDPMGRAQLDWKRRLSIINGIARGLLYLHEDSRLTIIHRDLKVSNILLDHEMNPKISDFGMARIFAGNQNQANTKRVVGTYGYMAPEYAMEGIFSVKSDIFSFGVLLLEIITGKRNSGFYLSEHGQSLLIYSWRLWCEGKGLEVMDPLLVNSYVTSEVLKCIHIGLLCVQEDAADRPNMSTVVVMLASDTVSLPQPTQPAFSVGRVVRQDQSSISVKSCSINEVTITDASPR